MPAIRSRPLMIRQVRTFDVRFMDMVRFHLQMMNFQANQRCYDLIFDLLLQPSVWGFRSSGDVCDD